MSFMAMQSPKKGYFFRIFKRSTRRNEIEPATTNWVSLFEYILNLFKLAETIPNPIYGPKSFGFRFSLLECNARRMVERKSLATDRVKGQKA